MAKKNGVYINVDMDTKQAEKSATKVNGALRNMAATAKAVRDEIGKSLKKGFQDSIVDNKDVQIDSVATAGYKALEKELEKIEAKMQSIGKARDKYLAGGGKENSSTIERQNYDLGMLEDEYDKVTAKMKAMEESGNAFLTPYENMKRLNSEIIEARNNLEALKAEQAQIKSIGGEESNAYASFSQQVTQAETEVNELFTQYNLLRQNLGMPIAPNIGSVTNIMEEVAQLNTKTIILKGLLSGLKGILKGIGFIGKKAFQGMIGAMKKTASGIRGLIGKLKSLKEAIGNRLHKSVEDTNKGFLKGLKTMIRYGIGVRSLFALINRLRSGLVEGMNNLAQFDSTTNKSLSSIKSSLTQVKNSFATAFSPILTVVAPIISKLCSMLSNAVTYIGMFFAALTGQSTFTKAVAVSEDYAAGLGASADNAEDASKKQKELNKQLYKFDDLNVQQKQNEPASSNGGGGGGGGVDPSQMFEQVELGKEFKNLADEIKKAWENADFTEIGGKIGSKLNEALNKIDWTEIQNTAQKIGKSLGTLITGFVETDGLGYTIGSTIGNAINTGIVGATAFIDNTNWASVGAFLGNGLNGMIDTIDWKGFGELLAKTFNAKFTLITWTLKTTDWKKLGDKFAETFRGFFKTFDYNMLGQTIGNTVKAGFDTVTGFLNGVDWGKVPRFIINSVKDFFAGMETSGMAQSIADFIIAAATALGEFLGGLAGIVADKISTEIKKGKEEYGSLGAWIWKGVLGGIKNSIANIGSWIKTNVLDKFVGGFKSAFQIHSPSKVMEEQGEFVLAGAKEGIVNKINDFMSPFKDIKDNILGKWGEIKTEAEAKWGEIVSSITGFGTKLKNALVGDNGSISKLKKEFINIFKALAKGVVKPINAVIDVINGMISGVVSGINAMIKALNKLKFDVPDWVPVIGGKSFGFNLSEVSAPSISHVEVPKLATGAVIPANREFLAMLGDQKHGTNLEAPESLIRQIVREESGSKDITIKFTGTGAELVRMLKPMLDKEDKRVGTRLVTGGV